ncbi:hypothetical protein DQ237_16755 [Blastococcus sp. TF02-8]|uniref:hypothetical protein n=1 Tax=Blastococcus sp. TF02-8 TaxID=2250574 RepID=UPI000DEA7087|nr:hypothetical protein [Blastococcus sp. TF02-8]RBY93630.1 hypothetical protein DQ237_16755 [Blastococcus sp. TF02-8]
MRIRMIGLAAVAATLPLGLAACGGPSVEDFCDQYQAIDQLEDEDAGKAKDAFDELADNVPDDAGKDVEEAVSFMADNFPEDGDFEKAVSNGDLDEDDAQKFSESAETVTAYGDKNCGD